MTHYVSDGVYDLIPVEMDYLFVMGNGSFDKNSRKKSSDVTVFPQDSLLFVS